MKCGKCGRENPEEAAFCAFCSAALGADAGGEHAIDAETPYGDPRTSGLAIASLVLGLLGLLTAGLTAILGLILGIVALRQIRRSEGRLAGDRLAKSGIAASAVIAVIVTLILVPVFGRARQAAQRSACSNNMHQIGLAMEMYCLDWALVPGSRDRWYDTRWPLADNWCDVLEPYVRSKKVLDCPSQPDSHGGYVYNKCVCGRSADDMGVEWYDGYRGSQIVEPKYLVVIFDGKGGWNACGGPESMELRHGESANVGYLDGHVKCIERTDELQWKPFTDMPGGKPKDL